MRLTLKTDEFKKMVAKATKGASNNKLLPITSMMLIEKSEKTGGKVCLTTTDMNNTLQVVGESYTGEDFYAVVPVDIFSKLIAKLTCEKLTLDVKDDVLKVTGNGSYKISLPVDEDGAVVFPVYEFVDSGDTTPIKLSTIKTILAVNKAALSTSAENDCYCGYYLHDKVVTSDENVICFNMLKICSEPIMLSREMLDLVALSKTEDISFHKNGSFVLFECEDIKVHGPVHYGIDEFPIEAMCEYLDRAFPSTCKVTKLSLQSVIDRLSLFIEPYDRNGAYFIFDKTGIKIRSKKASIEEHINYSDSSNFFPFACCVDVPMFKAQLDAIPTDVVDLSFGDDDALKLSSGNIVSVIALFEDEDITNSVVDE